MEEEEEEPAARVAAPSCPETDPANGSWPPLPSDLCQTASMLHHQHPALLIRNSTATINKIVLTEN